MWTFSGMAKYLKYFVIISHNINTVYISVGLHTLPTRKGGGNDVTVTLLHVEDDRALTKGT